MSGYMDEDLRDVIQFHGHLCPGLVLGYRVAKAALRELDAERPQDEELVAVVENDSCAADAIQYITGCTFGKGNLLFRDHGKHVYTFYNRRNGRAVRISEDFRGFDADGRFGELRKRQEAGEEVSDEMTRFKQEKATAILHASEEQIMTITPVTGGPPEPARVRASIRCASCGEKLMESKARSRDGLLICIPCAEKNRTD